MSDPYVLVTIAANGVKHAWGPFDTRTRADAVRQRYARAHPGLVCMTLKVLSPAHSLVDAQ